jgi:hypothetical protein
MCMGPYAGVDFNLTLRQLQSRLRHIHYGQPYMPESTLTLCHSRLYYPVRVLKFGLRQELRSTKLTVRGTPMICSPQALCFNFNILPFPEHLSLKYKNQYIPPEYANFVQLFPFLHGWTTVSDAKSRRIQGT